MEKFTAENNMDVRIVLEELQNLSHTEQMLIARIHPVISLRNSGVVSSELKLYKYFYLHFFRFNKISWFLKDNFAFMLLKFILYI